MTTFPVIIGPVSKARISPTLSSLGFLWTSLRVNKDTYRTTAVTAANTRTANSSPPPTSATSGMRDDQATETLPGIDSCT